MLTNACTQNLATRLGATSANLMPVSNISNMVTSDLDGADMYSVMAVLAAACNYNPVIFLKYPPNYVYSGIGISADSDNLSHRLDNAGLTGTCYPDVLNLLRKLDTYYATKFAKLVGMLDGVQNGDGSTLLDSSAAVWFQDSSDGCARNLNNLPIIQAGSCGGTFKTGWTINVENGAANLTQGNSEAQCAARWHRAGRRPQQGDRNRSEARQRADQQILLQPHERDGREGGRERIPHGGRQRGGDAVRLLRPDDGLLRRLRRGRGRWSPRPRRVHGPQSHLTARGILRHASAPPANPRGQLPATSSRRFSIVAASSGTKPALT